MAPLAQSVQNASNDDDDPDDHAFAGTEENVRYVAPDGTASTYRAYFYTYGGKLGWQVPQNFEFPARCKLDIGWKLWLQGLPGNQIVGLDGEVQAAPVRPFRKLNPKLLPKHLKSTYQLHWKPIFEMMERTNDLFIMQNPEQITAQFLEDSFAKAKEYLKTRVQYVFNKRRANPDMWEVSTWSKHVKKSSILCHGTEQDKAFFPQEATRPRIQRGKRHRPLQDRRRVRRRQVAGPEQPNEQPDAHTRDDSSEDSWQPDEVLAAQGLVEGARRDNELPNFVNQLTTAMLDHGRQIEHEMANKLNEDLIRLRHSRAAAQQVSDGDGGTLQVRMRLPSEGVNAANSNTYLAELRRQVDNV